jgi:hypothetical protein
MGDEIIAGLRTGCAQQKHVRIPSAVKPVAGRKLALETPDVTSSLAN